MMSEKQEEQDGVQTNGKVGVLGAGDVESIARCVKHMGKEMGLGSR